MVKEHATPSKLKRNGISQRGPRHKLPTPQCKLSSGARDISKFYVISSWLTVELNYVWLNILVKNIINIFLCIFIIYIYIYLSNNQFKGETKFNLGKIWRYPIYLKGVYIKQLKSEIHLTEWKRGIQAPLGVRDSILPGGIRFQFSSFLSKKVIMAFSTHYSRWNPLFVSNMKRRIPPKHFLVQPNMKREKLS